MYDDYHVMQTEGKSRKELRAKNETAFRTRRTKEREREGRMQANVKHRDSTTMSSYFLLS
jgi:hypothetical protein